MAYSDPTPGSNFVWNRLGQMSQAGRTGLFTRTQAWSSFGFPVSETWDALYGSITWQRDSLRRLQYADRGHHSTGTGALTLAQRITHSYDHFAGRLLSVGNMSFHPSTGAPIPAGNINLFSNYVANSALTASTTSRVDITPRLTQTRAYDLINRLQNISSANTGTPALSNGLSSITYDTANRRDITTLADGSYWDFGYDTKGQLTSAKKHLPGGTPVDGQQFDYSFDGIGNRTSVVPGSGTAVTFTPDSLNQYDNITTPGQFRAAGSANAAATVTVNSTATTRQGKLWNWNTTVSNTAGPVWQPLTIAATEGANTDTRTTGVLLPAAAVAPVYDLDGNLTDDGLRTYTWDAENRLTRLESHATHPAGATRTRIDHTYDDRSRRIRTDVSVWNGTAWTIAQRRLFHYDGWNLTAESDYQPGAGANTVVTRRSYVWGTDISGNGQSAGGIGGLIAIIRHNPTTQALDAHFPAYDSNGNITSLTAAATGNPSAVYEYDAFGNTLKAEGPMALENPFRFSTKYTDSLTGLYYYGYRWYDPLAGRWLSRDPIGEKGGLNLYGMMGNDAVNQVDALGNAPANTNHDPNGFGADTEWSFGSHTIEVDCPCISKFSYQRYNIKSFTWSTLSDFSRFKTSPGVNAELDILKDSSGATTAKFNLKGVDGLISDLSTVLPGGNSLTFDVDLQFDAAKGMITAETLGRHVLIGVRRWSYTVDGATNGGTKITIQTSAYEMFRSWIGEGGARFARPAMDAMWTSYIENVSQAVADKFSCKRGNILKASGSTRSSFNPYLIH